MNYQVRSTAGLVGGCPTCKISSIVEIYKLDPSVAIFELFSGGNSFESVEEMRANIGNLYERGWVLHVSSFEVLNIEYLLGYLILKLLVSFGQNTDRKCGA